MIKLIPIVLMLASASVFAQASSGANFEARKERVLKNHDTRVMIINEAKMCLEKANNPDQLKVCLDAERKAIADLKAKNTSKVTM